MEQNNKLPTDSHIKVGNDYYYQTSGPNNLGMVKQTKGRIIQQHGKDFLKQIPAYHAFTVVPSHTDYQQVVNNCYNLYKPFTHNPKSGECETILGLIKHVFGSDLVNIGKEDVPVYKPRWELGLDYLQILYRVPQQRLPVLCLGGDKRQAGKTTFGLLFDMLFSGNVLSVGAEDFKSDFNAEWANKLMIVCEETDVDSKEIMQKINRLNTADKIIMHRKGYEPTTVPFFAKFCLIGHGADTFNNVDRQEIRFWVIDVPQLQKPEPGILQKIRAEIGAFVTLLKYRRLVTCCETLHWFRNDLLLPPAKEETDTPENYRDQIMRDLSSIPKDEPMFLLCAGNNSHIDTLKDFFNRTLINNTASKKMAVTVRDMLKYQLYSVETATEQKELSHQIKMLDTLIDLMSENQILKQANPGFPSAHQIENSFQREKEIESISKEIIQKF